MGLTPNDIAIIAGDVQKNPSVVQWCPVCAGQTPPPLLPFAYPCPSCPADEVCGSCAPGASNEDPSITMFLNIGTCPACAAGDTKSDLHQLHAHSTQTHVTHNKNARKEAKQRHANVTIKTVHHRHPGQPSETTDTTYHTYGPNMTSSEVSDYGSSSSDFVPTESSTDSFDTTSVVIRVPSPPPPPPPALTVVRTAPGSVPVVRITPGASLGTTNETNGAILLPSDVDVPTTTHVKEETLPDGKVVYVVERVPPPPHHSPPWKYSPKSHPPPPPHNVWGQAPPEAHIPEKGYTPKSHPPPHSNFKYHGPPPGQVPTEQAPLTSSPPTVVGPAKHFKYVPGPAGTPPVREAISTVSRVKQTQAGTPYWSTTTTTSESTSDAAWHATPPATVGYWCSICLEKAPPVLAANSGIACPPCPNGQICTACPAGTVPSVARRSRALQGLPTWLGGKAAPKSSDSDAAAGGDVSNYVVGLTSTLPRNIGGPTAYLSATPCQMCGVSASA